MITQAPAAPAFDPATEQFNPFLPGVMDDPYPSYRALRDHSPVHHNPEIGTFFLSRYQDVYAAGRDFARFRRGTAFDRLFTQHEGTAIQRLGEGNIFSTDEDVHARLKGFIAKAFTRRPVGALAARIGEICEKLLDDAGVGHGADRLDLIDQFGYPLPSQVICELLGIPSDDRMPFLAWVRRFVPLLDPFPTPEVVRDAIDGMAAFEGYLTAVLGDRRRALRSDMEPPPGLLTDLVAVSEQSADKLSSKELMTMVWVLIAAGFENITNLIGNVVRALAENPLQRWALRDNPDLYDNLADETLRCFTSPQYNFREMGEPVELDGVTLPAGSQAALLRGSANRDERRFTDPDSYDLRRQRAACELRRGLDILPWGGADPAGDTSRVPSVAGSGRRLVDQQMGAVTVVLVWGPRLVEVEFTGAL